MTVLRISDSAIDQGSSQIERQLVQLDVLRRLPGGGQIALANTHSTEVLQLAKWRGLPLSEQEPTSTIEDEWASRLTVTVVIACHNYGHYLDEAITSVLGQSYLPDEIILSDDASTDDSPEIMRNYAARYPELIRLNLNESNQGIQAHFNNVAALATNDLLVFIGADNRVPSNYIESQFVTLALNEDVGMAYTDFALFGGRAKNDYERMLPQFQGERLLNGVYMSNFPEYNEESAQLLRAGNNFIHGSTMYRKELFERVGGYIDRSDGPEDMSLFQAMLATGAQAKKVHDTALEYRQHSSEQANYQFSYFGELRRLREENQELPVQRRLVEQLRGEIQDLRETIERKEGVIESQREEIELLSEALKRIRSSASFRFGSALLSPARKIVRVITERK